MSAQPPRLDGLLQFGEAGSSAWVADLVQSSAGILLLAAIVFAPWFWACTWPLGVHLLDLLILSAGVLGLVGAVTRPPHWSRWLVIALTLILAQGWFLTLNSKGIFAGASGLAAPLEQSLEGCPGSIERDLSWETMARLTSVLGAALVAAQLGARRVWRFAFAYTLTATAVSITLLGCAERWTHAGDIFWGTSRHLDYFFASFRNVTTAGESINVALPLALTWAWDAAGKSARFRAASVCAVAILVAGSFICGSKIAPLLTLGLLGVFLFVQRRDIRLPLKSISPAQAVMLAAGVVGVALITWGAGPGVTWERWQRLLNSTADATLTDRWRADLICLAASPQAGFCGFGPGTFPVVFPGLEDGAAGPPAGLWLFAHDDYLQSILEWGWLGSAAWSLYGAGAIVSLMGIQRRRSWRREDRTLSAGLLASLLGIALMALIDFPLQMACLQLDFAVVAGLGWSARTWPRARN